MIGNIVAGVTYFEETIGDFESIATVTVGAGGAANVEFSSIPSTYQHLQIRGIVRSSAASASQNTLLRLNTDTAANYSTHYLTGNGTTAASGAEANSTYIYAGALPAANTASGRFEAFVIDILDYKDTNKYTTVRTLAGWDANGTGLVALWSGSWRNTAAVNAIRLLPNTGNFIEFSSIALYGIKG